MKEKENLEKNKFNNPAKSSPQVGEKGKRKKNIQKYYEKLKTIIGTLKEYANKKCTLRIKLYWCEECICVRIIFCISLI